METEAFSNVDFYLNLGAVTVLAGILTLVITEIGKAILRKKKILTAGTNAVAKDLLLARLGRYTALVIYTVLYLGHEWLMKRQLIFDVPLITGLLSGGALTLTVAKGLYTAIRQHRKKSDVFARLKKAEEQVRLLSLSASEPEAEPKVWKITRKTNIN